jgi:hypothetical protein
METMITVLFNPITILIVGVIALLAAMVSPYEIKFDELDEEIEI